MATAAHPPGTPPRRLQPLCGPRSAAEAEGRAAAAAQFWQPDELQANALGDKLKDMSVAQLRGFISAAGLSFADCVEKSDLIDRAREAEATGARAATSLFTPEPEPVPARATTQAGAKRQGAPAAHTSSAPAQPRSQRSSSTRSLFGQDGVKIDAGAAPATPNSSRTPAPASPADSVQSDGGDLPVRLDRAHCTPEFWQEESGWRNAPLLNVVIHIRAAAMLVAGFGSFVLAQQGAEEDAATPDQSKHCTTLRRWVLVGSASVALVGAMAPLTWHKLRATKLERGVGTAKRLREKGFGNSRLGRSKQNARRHRGYLERLGTCVAFPVIACFIGVQVVGFSAETAQCPESLQISSTLFICCLYFVLCFQCICIQGVQCSLWKELDLTLLDDEADEEHDRSIRRTRSTSASSRGDQHVPEP